MKLICAALALAAAQFPADAARYLELTLKSGGLVHQGFLGTPYDSIVSFTTTILINTETFEAGDPIDLNGSFLFGSLFYSPGDFSFYADGLPEYYNAAAAFDPIDLSGTAVDETYFNLGSFEYGYRLDPRYDVLGYLDGSLNSLRVRTFDNDADTASSASIQMSAEPAPEPATWSFMILGFGAVGMAMRGYRRVTVRLG